MTNDVARVMTLHQEGGLNCSQAMLSIYGQYFGLPEELAIKVATAFGGGMGGMGQTCGAVTGAFMVLGLTYETGNPDSRSEVYALVKKFTESFMLRHGTITCKDLLGFDMNCPKLEPDQRKKLVSTICSKIDQSAAEIVEELLAGRLHRTSK